MLQLTVIIIIAVVSIFLLIKLLRQKKDEGGVDHGNDLASMKHAPNEKNSLK